MLYIYMYNTNETMLKIYHEADSYWKYSFLSLCPLWWCISEKELANTEPLINTLKKAVIVQKGKANKKQQLFDYS